MARKLQPSTATLETQATRRVRLIGLDPFRIPGTNGLNRHGYYYCDQTPTLTQIKRNGYRIPTTFHRWKVSRPVVDGILAAEKAWHRQQQAGHKR